MTMLNGEPIDTPNISTVPAGCPPPAPFTTDPTARVLGVMSLIFAFALPVAGIVLGAIGLSMAKRAGSSNSLAKLGLILSIVFTIVIVVIVVVTIVFSVGLFSELFRVCQQLGEGVHDYNGVTYTCS